MNISLSGPQMKFLSSKKRISALVTGVGGGKTFVGALWSIVTAVANPGVVGLVGASNPAQLNAVLMKAFQGLLDQCGIEWVSGSEPPWYRSKFDKHFGILSLSNGSQIVCRSLHESGVDRNVRGLEIGWAWIDEARDVTQDAIEVVLSRLRAKCGPNVLRLTSTPAGTSHWLCKKLLSQEAWPNVDVIRGTTIDNEPNLPQGYVEMLRQNYSSELYLQEVEGEFLMIGVGRVHHFSADNVLEHPFDKRLPIIFSLDFNVSPMGGIVMQVDQKKRQAWVLDEINIKDDATTASACEQFLSRWGGKAESCWWIGDEAGGARSTRSYDTDLIIMRKMLQGKFLRLRALNDGRKPRVVDRINSVNSLLDPPGEQVPRLFVAPRCRETVADLELLQWMENGRRQVDKSDNARSHWADALGYAIDKLLPVRPPGPVMFGWDPDSEGEKCRNRYL